MNKYTYKKLLYSIVLSVVSIAVVFSLTTCSGLIQGLKGAFPVGGTENQKKIIAENFWAQFFDETETQVATADIPIESVPLDSIDRSNDPVTELNKGQQEQTNEADSQFNDSRPTQVALACPENSLSDDCIPGNDLENTNQIESIDQTQQSAPQTNDDSHTYLDDDIPLNNKDSAVQPLIITDDSDEVPIPTNNQTTANSNQSQTSETELIQSSTAEPVENTLNQNSTENTETSHVATDSATDQINTANLTEGGTQPDLNQSKIKLLRWPVTGRVIAKFDSERNEGINLAVPEGTPIKVAEDGIVLYTGDELEDLGRLVIVRHSGGWVTVYAHVKDFAQIKEEAVKRGVNVKRGDVIAYAGATGPVDFPQLHFELRNPKNIPVNPLNYLPQQ